MTDRLSSTALRILGTRDALSELSAINTTILKNGSCVYVTSLRDFFFLLKDSTATANGTEVVAPLSGPGRWFRWNIGVSVWEQQSDWYVDEQNVSGAASDSNIGDVSTAPLASYAELTRRIREANIQQDTTVHLLSDVNASSVFQFMGRIAAPSVLTIIGEAPTQLLGNTTLTAVQNLVVGTDRPSIQAGGLDWTTAGPGGTSLVGKRARVVSSVGAQEGALFWIEAVDAGDPTIAYITRAYEAANPPAFGVVRSLAVNDVIVVEELTKAGLLDIQFQGNGIVSNANATTSVLLQDLRGPGNNTSIAVLGSLTFAEGVTAYGCSLDWARTLISFGNLMACQVGAVAAATNFLVATGGSTFLSACSGSAAGANLTIAGPGSFQLFDNCSFNSRLIVADNFAKFRVFGSVSFWEWQANQAAIQVQQSSFVDVSGEAWGTSANAGTLGIEVLSGAHFQYGIEPTVTGAAVNDFEVGGVGNVYAMLPAAGQDPGNNSAWLVVRAA